jgi:hypothetical protein
MKGDVRFSGDAALVDKRKINGVWYQIVSIGDRDGIYEDLKREIKRINEDQYQKRIYTITDESGDFFLWQSVYSLNNLVKFPAYCENIRGNKPFVKISR